MKYLSLILPVLLFISCAQTKHSTKYGIDIAHLSYVDSLIENAILQEDIPGAVLGVVRYDKLVYLKAFGNKQVYPDTIPMTTNTVFDLASLSKPVGTALSLMVLLDRGQVRLNDNVSQYIPWFQPWKDSTNKETPIKIIHLLSHTSGLPAYASIEELKKKYATPNPEGLLEHISTVPRRFKPATGFMYSCLNFITLQHIIENVSGSNLQQFAQTNLFEPLGMRHTDYNPTGETLALVAPTELQKDGSCLKGHVHDPLARIMNGGISGNAGVFSNVEDLAILAAMLLNEGTYKGKQIISPAGIRKMRTVPLGYEDFGRALGWDVASPYNSNHGELFSGQTYGHTGYTGTSMILDPETKTAVIFLTNRPHPEDKGSVGRLRSLIANVVAASLKK